MLAFPAWGALALRELLLERRRPVLELYVGGRHSLPDARALRTIADAPDVRGLHVQIDGLVEGWASLAAAREALLAIRKAGKFVSIELERCSNAELYLASAADRVWVRPMVQVHLFGVGAALRFAGDAFARFGLRFDMESAGAYKSFGETFTRGFASPENREAMSDIVAGLEAELEQAIADGRRLSREVVRQAVLDAPLDPEDAQRIGLIDGALYPDAVRTELESLFGREYARVSFGSWHRARAARVRIERWMEGRRRIAVVHLAGAVVDGDGAPGAQVIAARPVTRALDALAEDDQVAAVVLDIRSPGGSATASDVIWRAVERLGRRKPVVAVLGDVAASGGYYIAVAASEILTGPNTLTGSIGVVGGKLVIGEALSRLGVHTELILGAPGASTFSAETPFDPVQRERFRAGLLRFYRAFVDRVAAGRRRPFEVIEPLARGRVWTGRRAVELGLADRIGTVDDGIARAALLSGVTTPAVREVRLGLPTPRWMRLVRAFTEELAPELRLLPRLPDSARLLAEHPGVPLVLWPWDVEIR
ncbi:MAG: S49 family peptidase [Pseudomonadota bacterium]|nr:S49 family peptidase [Pseudomonadota bacterium]